MFPFFGKPKLPTRESRRLVFNQRRNIYNLVILIPGISFNPANQSKGLLRRRPGGVCLADSGKVTLFLFQHKALLSHHKALLFQHRTLFSLQEALLFQHKALFSQQEALLFQHKTMFSQQKPVLFQRGALLSQQEASLFQHETLLSQHKAVLFQQEAMLFQQNKTIALHDQNICCINGSSADKAHKPIHYEIRSKGK